MSGVVTAAATEVEQGARRPLAVGLEEAPVEGSLLDVVAYRGQQGIPVRQVAVEPGLCLK
jgi:hypothetical protein